MRASRLLIGFGAALAACTAAVSGGPSTAVPGNQPPNRLPRPEASGNAAGPNKAMRYVCRGQESTGWIAVDYIDDSDGCPTTRARYGTAVVVPLANTAVGGVLEVCADQRIPTNWHQVDAIPGDPRCPSSKPTSDPGRTAVRRIIRER